MKWQNRPCDPIYLVVWMAGIIFNIRDNGKIVNKALYLCVSFKQNCKKEVLGMWVNKSERTSFRINVLTDLKTRDVQDVLISSTDKCIY